MMKQPSEMSVQEFCQELTNQAWKAYASGEETVAKSLLLFVKDIYTVGKLLHDHQCSDQLRSQASDSIIDPTAN